MTRVWPALGCIVALATGQQPPRDARQAPRTGTAAIRGIVQTTDERPAALRRARAKSSRESADGKPVSTWRISPACARSTESGAREANA